jgi:serine protease Do
MKEFLASWDALKRGEFIGEGPFATKPEKGSGFIGMATDPRPEGGLVVTKVGKKTPAEDAGVNEGDVILKMNGNALAKREDLRDLLKEMAAGDEVVLDIQRDGKPLTITLNLGER